MKFGSVVLLFFRIHETFWIKFTKSERHKHWRTRGALNTKDKNTRKLKSMALNTKDKNTQKLAVALSCLLRPEDEHYKHLINTSASKKGAFFEEMVKYLSQTADTEESKALFQVKGTNNLGEKITAILEANPDSKLPRFRTCREGLRKYR